MLHLPCGTLIYDNPCTRNPASSRVVRLQHQARAPRKFTDRSGLGDDGHGISIRKKPVPCSNGLPVGV